MKKIILLAAAPLLLAACSSDDNGPDSGDTRVPLRLTSGIEVQTRANTQGTAIVSGETVYAWVDDVTPGDETEGTERIASPLYEANELTAGDNGTLSGSLMYFPATGHNVDIYAIHGKIETDGTQLKEFPDTDGLKYSVNPDQSEVGGTGYTNSDLLYAVKQNVARTTSTVPLTFYHMLSKIELAIKVGNGSPTLASTGAVKLNNVTLNGKFTPSKTTGDISSQSTRAGMLSSSDNASPGDMTLGQATCTDFGDNVVYNEAIVVPQDMSGKTLTFSLADGGTLTYTIQANSNSTFESGKKYIYLITLDLTGLTVTSTVTDWQTGATSTGSATM